MAAENAGELPKGRCSCAGWVVAPGGRAE